MAEVSTLGSMGEVLRQLASAPADFLVRGTVIDEQYEVERVLGQGAMGVVYLASDRRLERNVAIKLVKDRSATALSRASREAMALARLSHPNVVVIHQVGELEGRVYVAMEYVAGTNGREWAEKQRGVAEVLAVYLAVGDGLAAAHAAGLVHRDFKPDNVLVGDDGRARVADFGLARSEPTALAVGSVEEQRSQIAGTPAYMAPEQYRGEVIDARADQFAYCTSMWEALHGKRPFAGDSAEAISNAKAVLVRGEPERARRIPRHIDIALRRGLSNARDERWPSMEPLLAELRRDPRRKWRALIAVPIVATILFFALRGNTSTDACDGGAARIAERWGAPQIAQLETMFSPAGAPAWDVSAVHSAIAETNTWSEHWAQSYRNVCRAGWSAQLHDRGMLCLARAEHGLAGTLAALDATIGATNLDKIFASVPRPEPCTDPAYLEADVPPPANPAVAAAVANREAELQGETTVALAGEHDRAEQLLQQVEHAPALDYAPLAAHIHLARAETWWDREDPRALDALVNAYFEARDAGARGLATHAAEEISALQLEVSHDAESAQWARLAMTEAASVNDSLVKMRATISHANTLIAQNQAQLAVDELTSILAKVRADGQGDRAAHIFHTRADAYDKLGKYELALADTDEALRLYTLSSQANASAANLESERSLILIHMNRIPDAIVAARAGLAMAEKTEKPGSVTIGTLQGSLGTALTEAGQFDEALALQDQSLATDVRKGGSYNIASDYNNRCDLLQRMNRVADAIADCKKAAALWVESVGAESREEGLTQGNLAEALSAQPADSLVASALAIKLLGKNPDDPLIFSPLLAHATASRKLGHIVEARHDLDAAEKFVAQGAPTWPYDLAYWRAELELADGHLEAARSLATTSHDGYAKLGDTAHADRATALLHDRRFGR